MDNNNQRKAKLSTANLIGMILLSIALIFDILACVMDFESPLGEDVLTNSEISEDTEENTENVEKPTESQSTEEKSMEKINTEFHASDYRMDITYESLLRMPDNYKEMKIQMTGTVVQVLEGKGELDLIVNVENADNTYLVCQSDVTDVRILENDEITFYGVYQGVYTYETVVGSENTVPLFNVDKIDINNYDGTSDSPTGELREGTYMFEDGEVTSVAEFAYQDGEAFYCRIYAVSDDNGYGYVEGFLTDNGDGTYTGIVDGGTFDILAKGSSIIVTTYPDNDSSIFIFERLDGEYVYQ